MTPRELVIKTLNHEPVARVVRDLWLPQGEESVPADGLAELNVRYPSDIVQPEVAPRTKETVRQAEQGGRLHGPLGLCLAQGRARATPELKQSPLAEAEKIAAYQPPPELLDKARFCQGEQGLPGDQPLRAGLVRGPPFDRLRFLRGSEAAPVDLARGTQEVRGLLAALHDFHCKEIELWRRRRSTGSPSATIGVRPKGC